MIIGYYSSATGQVTKVLQAPDPSRFPQPNVGEEVIELGAIPGLPGWIEGGSYFGVPDQPNPKYVFDWALKKWVDPRTLADFKLEKQAHLKKQRDAAEFSPFTYNGMVFDGDLDAQRRLGVLVSAAKSAIAAGYSFTKEFTLADNTVAQLTAEDFIGIEMAKLWQVDVAFQEYRAKRAAIEAATTLEELEAIVV